MRFLRISRHDALRGGAAGAEAVAVRGAAQTLFEAGGRAVLPEVVQTALRGAVEREASRVLTGVGLLEAGASSTARVLEGGAVPAIASQTARAAGRQLLRGISRAAGAGAMIDGGWALVQGIRAVQRGAMTRRQAAAHVAREAGTGAAATAAGTAAAAILVTLTGGIAAPAVFVVGAAASLGAKMALDSWVVRRAYGPTTG